MHTHDERQHIACHLSLLVPVRVERARFLLRLQTLQGTQEGEVRVHVQPHRLLLHHLEQVQRILRRVHMLKQRTHHNAAELHTPRPDLPQQRHHVDPIPVLRTHDQKHLEQRGRLPPQHVRRLATNDVLSADAAPHDVLREQGVEVCLVAPILTPQCLDGNGKVACTPGGGEGDAADNWRGIALNVKIVRRLQLRVLVSV